MDDDHRSVDESRSAALQQSDEAPIDGHSKSKCAKSTEDSLLSSIMANVRVARSWLGITHSRTHNVKKNPSTFKGEILKHLPKSQSVPRSIVP